MKGTVAPLLDGICGSLGTELGHGGDSFYFAERDACFVHHLGTSLPWSVKQAARNLPPPTFEPRE